MFELLNVAIFDWIDPIGNWANRMRDCSGGHVKKFSLFLILNEYRFFLNCKTGAQYAIGSLWVSIIAVNYVSEEQQLLMC